MAGGFLWLAVKLLTGGDDLVIEAVPGNLTGGSGIVIDRLSAFFMVVVSLGAFSAALYSWGYLKTLQAVQPAAHMSLHLFCFVLLSPR